jgi:hypothetical protein
MLHWGEALQENILLNLHVNIKVVVTDKVGIQEITEGVS